jgi:hypothetical protein
MNLKGCGRRRSWSNSKPYLAVSLKGLRDAANTCICRTIYPSRVSNQDLPEFKLEATQSKPTFSFSHEPVILM